jgi:hypothetical protein
MREIAVLLTIRCDDARLEDWDKITAAADMVAVRQAVVDAVPADTTRVVALMPMFKAQAMMMAMATADTALGQPPVYPPKDYVPANGRG